MTAGIRPGAPTDSPSRVGFLPTEIEMAGTDSFRYEVEKSGESRADMVTTITCHGRLVSENSAEVKEVVRALLPHGGRIVVDLSDVSYLDSSGLGMLVGLKVSAIKQAAHSFLPPSSLDRSYSAHTSARRVQKLGVVPFPVLLVQFSTKSIRLGPYQFNDLRILLRKVAYTKTLQTGPD